MCCFGKTKGLSKRASSKIFMIDNNVDVFSGGKECDLPNIAKRQADTVFPQQTCLPLSDWKQLYISNSLANDVLFENCDSGRG